MDLVALGVDWSSGSGSGCFGAGFRRSGMNLGDSGAEFVSPGNGSWRAGIGSR